MSVTKYVIISQLTSRISATMDQLRFRVISPINTKAKHMKMSIFAKKNTIQIKRDEMINPKPQIRGSEKGYFSRRIVLRIIPKGTPNIPDTIVTTPKTTGTLKIFRQMSKQRIQIISLVDLDR